MIGRADGFIFLFMKLKLKLKTIRSIDFDCWIQANLTINKKHLSFSMLLHETATNNQLSCFTLELNAIETEKSSQ